MTKMVRTESLGSDLQAEVAALYQAFKRSDHHRITPRPDEARVRSETGRLLNRYVYAPGLAALVLLALSLFTEWQGWRLAFLLVLLVSYIGLFGVSVADLFMRREELRTFLRNPLELFFDGATEALATDLELCDLLRNTSLDALNLVHVRFCYAQDAVRARTGMIAGAIDAVGLVPGILSAFWVAYDKSNDLAMVFAFVLFVIYCLATIGLIAAKRLALYAALIQRELDLRKVKEAT